MSLRQAGMHATQFGAGVFALRADEDASIRITRIGFYNDSATNPYLECFIDRKSVGFFRARGPADMSDIPLNWFAGFGAGAIAAQTLVNIFDHLKAIGRPLVFPLATGQTFRITTIAGAAYTWLDVQYDLYDPGDVSKDEPNGTESKEWTWIERGSNAAAVAVGTLWYRMVDSITPGPYPDFPFEGPVAAKTKIEMLGIVGQPCAQDDGAAGHGCATTWLQLVREREILLDPAGNGLMFSGNRLEVAALEWLSTGSIIGHNQSSIDQIYMLPTPLVFQSGEELVVNVGFDQPLALIPLPIGTLDVGFILREVRE